MDYTDAQQRNISKTDVDYVAQHSGKNIKGYQPGAFPPLELKENQSEILISSLGGQVDAVNHFWTEQVRYPLPSRPIYQYITLQKHPNALTSPRRDKKMP